MSVQFLNAKYSWKEMSLWQFLEEGNIPSGWNEFFIKSQNILYKISEELEKEKKKNTKLVIYPPVNNVFRAFIPLDKIKVVIIGQDPYHNGSAVGYCFSVLPGNSINPSLKNIYKQLKNEDYEVKEDGILTHWVDQGCFMLNTSLTVEKANVDSHTSFWYDFTENVIRYVTENTHNIVWLLMGAKAHKFSSIIINSKNNHKTFETTHPSPFSAHKGTNMIPAFFGSDVFTQINDKLKEYGKSAIEW